MSNSSRMACSLAPAYFHHCRSKARISRSRRPSPSVGSATGAKAWRGPSAWTSAASIWLLAFVRRAGVRFRQNHIAVIRWPIFNHAGGCRRDHAPVRVTTLWSRIVSVHPIRIAGDPVLHNRTRSVMVVDDELQALVDDMFDTMTAANGVGLAANQIGVDLRLFVYDCPDGTGARQRGVVINPVLQTSEVPETMPDPEDDLEGCLSVPGETFPTGRAKWARVTGLDADGNPIEVQGPDLFARMLQHEAGHLDGMLYLDRLVGRHARAA